MKKLTLKALAQSVEALEQALSVRQKPIRQKD
jgi:hypothetical protein